MPLAYFYGDDSFAIDRAITSLARELGGADTPLEIWKLAAEDDSNAASESGPSPASRRLANALDEIAQRVATAPMFGSGTLVVVSQPQALVRSKAGAERLLQLIGDVAPGNGIAFVEIRSDTRRATASTDAVRNAVAARGGVVKEFRVPGREGMERWIESRAQELGTRLGAGAARLLAEKVGAYVREGDVDRRNQTVLANAELEKLMLYRPSASITRTDIDELVPDAIPGSMWAFLDAVAARRSRDAAGLAERLLAAGTPAPVIVVQLHRRLRELIDVRQRLANGTRAQELARAMRMR